jgi:low affinity Fe/Cu permease
MTADQPTLLTRCFRQALTAAGVFTAHPAAFLIVFCYVLTWLALDPATLDSHVVATVATWLMTLIIRRAEHRDTQAIHAELYELLRVDAGARSELSRMDEQEPETTEEQRSQERQPQQHTVIR